MVPRTMLGGLAVMLGAMSPAQGQAIGVGPLERCVTNRDREDCRPISIDRLDLADPIDHVRRTVVVSPKVAASQLPLAVTLVGTMSAEVRWNGAPIGGNGVIGPDRASETAGRFHATIPIPRQVVRPGRNVVDIRMSAHHRWLPVRMPVQRIEIGYYEGRSSRELLGYWPALLTAGALLLAMIYFGVVAVVGRHRRDALILAAASASTALQLSIETSRSFVDYAYPWHIARISAIALLAATTGTLVCAYAALRFRSGRAMLVSGISVATSVVAITVLPSFDARAWACLAAAGLICLLCAASAARNRRDGRVGVVVALLFTSMLFLWRADSLDRGYYLFMATLLAGLIAEQVFGLRHIYSGYDTEREHSATLQTRLRAAENAGNLIVSIQDGSTIHRLLEKDIVQITAADDFCEVKLTSRSPLLVSGTMKALAMSLPARFLRVHKSHIVNLVHVAGVNPRPGGGHQLVLEDGSIMPVGRTYRDIVFERLAS